MAAMLQLLCVLQPILRLYLKFYQQQSINDGVIISYQSC